MDPSSDYTGEIKIILYNHTSQHFLIERGQKFTQIIFERIILPSEIEFQGTKEVRKKHFIFVLLYFFMDGWAAVVSFNNIERTLWPHSGLDEP